MMIKYASLEIARQTVGFWSGEPESLLYLGDSGNSVYRFKKSAGSVQILRFIDPSFRTKRELEGEIEFLQYLQAGRT